MQIKIGRRSRGRSIGRMLAIQRPLTRRCSGHHQHANASIAGLMNTVNASSTSSTPAAKTGVSTQNQEEGRQAPPVHEEYWRPPPGMPKVAWYRRMLAQKWPEEKKPWEKHGDTWDGHRQEHLTPGDLSLVGVRLNDYYKMQEIVNWLPTVKEKIDFVNPYEREWSVAERRWHGKWMQRLVQPRKAWAVPQTPTYFDSLNFYKYITKCRLIDGQEAKDELDKYFKSLSLPTRGFEKRVSESLAFLMGRDKMAEVENHSDEEKAENRAKFLRSMIEDAHLEMANGNQKVLDHRISYNPRCESFWIRAGFKQLYENKPIWEVEENPPNLRFPRRKFRFGGDDRRRLGELSFTMRDKFVCQVRTKAPMRNLFDWPNPDRLHAPLFADDNLDVGQEVIFSPKVHNMFMDSDILWQCPGYEYDCEETHKYGRLAVKDISPLVHRLDNYWAPDSQGEREQMLDECVKATAIVSLFNWLNAQAHCLGNTQYTELEAPLTSQLVLTDGRQNFWFAIAQLNTLVINIDVEGLINRRTNCCYVDGPYQLYERADSSEPGNIKFWHHSTGEASQKSASKWVKSNLEAGLNPSLLERLLQMCIV